MNYDDTGRLLAYAAAFDKRTVGDADVLAWHDVLSDLDFDAAKQTVRTWYAENDGFIQPAHIRAAVRPAADRHPSARPLSEAPRYPDFDVDKAKAWLAECEAQLGKATHEPYRPRAERGRTRRDERVRPRETDADRARAGRPITICHRCAVDIPAPAGWDPADPTSPPLYCPPCQQAPRP